MAGVIPGSAEWAASLVAIVADFTIPVPIPEPIAVTPEPEMTFIPSFLVNTDPSCCGVRHFRNMQERWTFPIGTPYQKQKEVLTINVELQSSPIAEFIGEYPELYKEAYLAWENKINEECVRQRNGRVATIIMHFAQTYSTKTYMAAIMREVIKNRLNAVNMGEYKNPNTGNIINGWCIPTSFKRNNRLDKEKK